MTASDTNPFGTWFSVVKVGEAFPPIFVNSATRATQPAAFRLAGGCSGMSDEARARVVPYFVEGLPAYQGVAISGATNSPDGKPMVTNVPAALAAAYGAIALGTCPRTADMALPDTGSVVVSKYGDSIDRGQHAVAVVQRNAADVLEWDGDLRPYIELLCRWRDEADWKVGLITFNGGAVTRDECRLAVEAELPVIIVRGSGRFADVFACQHDAEPLDRFTDAERKLVSDDAFVKAAVLSGLVSFADFGDPVTLTAAAKKIGLLV